MGHPVEEKIQKIGEKVSKGITPADITSPSFREILKKDIQSSVDKKIEENIDMLQDKKELEVTESKKDNIVLFNVPESGSEKIEDRMRHDRQMFLMLYDITKEDFDDKSVKLIHRVGKKSKENTRPMLIKFTKNETKTKYMKASGDLALNVEEDEVKVYASHDLTKNQRTKMKELAAEVKVRNEKGEKDIVIRNFRIVKKSTAQTDDRRKWDRGPQNAVHWDSLFWKN